MRTRIVAIIALLASWIPAFAASANFSCTVPAAVKTLKLYIGPTTNAATKVVSFSVPVTTVSQEVTNLCTNLVSGVNFVAATCVGTNGLESDPTPLLRVDVPAAPTNLITVPLSLIVPVGTPIQISRDGVTWTERLVISEAPNFSAFALASGPVSAPNGSLVSLTYRALPDQPMLFFRQQPPANQPPLP